MSAQDWVLIFVLASLVLIVVAALQPKLVRSIETLDVDRLQAVPCMPGDVIILHHPKAMSDAAMKRFRADFERLVPGRKCILLEDGVKMAGVVRMNATDPVMEALEEQRVYLGKLDNNRLVH